MFNDSDFQVFEDPTLPGRMTGIRHQIDPKFEALAPLVIEQLALEQPIYAHVAKHLRRHKNPPMNTWVAFSANPRGYKMVPHLMIGFWDDRLFVWLATLAEAKERAKMTTKWAELLPQLQQLDSTYEISPNHMAKPFQQLSAANLTEQLTHYQQVKQADFLVGKQWFRGDSIFDQPAQLQAELLSTTRKLRPFLAALIKA